MKDKKDEISWCKLMKADKRWWKIIKYDDLWKMWWKMMKDDELWWNTQYDNSQIIKIE